MAAYLGAWTRRRALDRLKPGEKVSGMITGAARRELRRRVVGRAGSSSASVLPLLAGAVAGASLNASQTRRLGRQITAGLR
jgi:outer membrane lipoprotein SlyB